MHCKQKKNLLVKLIYAHTLVGQMTTHMVIFKLGQILLIYFHTLVVNISSNDL